MNACVDWEVYLYMYKPMGMLRWSSGTGMMLLLLLFIGLRTVTTDAQIHRPTLQRDRRSREFDLQRRRQLLPTESEFPRVHRYIVRLRNDSAVDKHELHRVIDEFKHNAMNQSLTDFIADGLRETHAALEGFSGRLSDRAMNFLLRSNIVADYTTDTEVFIIEPSQNAVRITQAQVEMQYRSANSTTRRRQTQDIFEQQVSSTLWNLDRVDQRSGLNGIYAFQQTGNGVDVYVVDSGVRFSHQTFEGRAFHGANFFGGSNEDCQGHGTHVAGTVGGSNVGLAKSVRIISVKVFGCQSSQSTSTSNIIDAIEWVIEHNKKSNRRAVLNLSLGGEFNSLLNFAVETAAKEGIIVVAAAGNDGQSACHISPASAWSAITVASTTRRDTFSSFSSRGACVDILTGGSDIASAWFERDDQYAIISGTSMAAPAVSGIVARYLVNHPTGSTEDVRKALFCMASTNIIENVPALTPNVFLYVPSTGIEFEGSKCKNGALESCPGTPACFERGLCSSSGRCDCFCNWLGSSCLVEVKVKDLHGLQGSIKGSTVNAPDSFGYETGDAYFALPIGQGAEELSLTLCHKDTNFATVMWLLDACFSNSLSQENVVGFNEKGESCPAARSGTTSSSIKIENPPAGRYYILVEGVVTDGTFVLSWQVTGTTTVPSSSPSSTVFPSPSNHRIGRRRSSAFRNMHNSITVQCVCILLGVFFSTREMFSA